MATIPKSSIMHGASGKVGDLVFRQFNGKTVVQAYDPPAIKRSPLQKVFNNKMREAAHHAKTALRDPAVRAHYEKKKKRLNINSAYTAACTDFLRHGRIDSIDTTKSDKGLITVKAFKPDLGFEKLVVKIHTADGKLITATQGVARQQAEWHFKLAEPLPPLQDVTITVAATDKTGNVTRVVQRPGSKTQEFHDWRGSPHLAASSS
jgi:hypothetical protein